MNKMITRGLGIALLASLAACKKNNSPYSSNSSGNSSGSNNGAVVNGINPTSGPFNTIDTIGGAGFDPNPAKDSVWFNGVAGTIKAATANQLIVEVPKFVGEGQGPVTVKVDNGKLITGPLFNYKSTPVVSTFAGNSTAGLLDGVGIGAEFNQPSQVAADAAGNIYIADAGNNAVRRMTGYYVTGSGTVTTIAGTGTAGTTDGNKGTATLTQPLGVAVDSTGTVFVAEGSPGGGRIRKITAAGVVSLLAGKTTGTPPGFADGTGINVQFSTPTQLALGPNDLIYLTDQRNNMIRSVNQAGTSATVAGIPGNNGNTNGNLSVATFGFPIGIARDKQGNIYIADAPNHCIREILVANGLVFTYAGSTNGVAGYADGPADQALFNYPFGLAFDAVGNLYVADAGNNLIRVISSNELVSTLAGVQGAGGYADGIGNVAKFNTPTGLAVDLHGNVYVGDTQNNRIRFIQWQ